MSQMSGKVGNRKGYRGTDIRNEKQVAVGYEPDIWKS